MSAEIKEWQPLTLIKVTAQFLASKDIVSPRLDAEVLLAAVLDCSRLDLYAQKSATALTAAQLTAYREFIRRRADREPVSRILGKKEFMNYEFAVGPAVLSPRPETEILVEQTLRLLSPAPKVKKSAAVFQALDLQVREFLVKQTDVERGGVLPQELLNSLDATEVKAIADAPPFAAPRILDLGCGSGCVAIALAKKIPAAQITAVDISPAALALARQNAEHLGVGEQIKWALGDWFGALSAGEKFDVIAANPPYVARAEELPPEVKNYDPPLALFGGDDGLDAYRAIVARAGEFLAPDGCLLFEVGAGQAPAVSALIKQKFPAAALELTPDYAGIERVVTAKIPAVAG
ncbi:hypothetical protein FACS1894139_12620 [Planctomycetales bacterium]|nr:hypothetical protein FACS1894107_13750 [Planctomycetales bacterium]GHS98777.1 hypothetical protein FACS1894108_07530 [Planctomycetales bacterium]GHT06542.1 hypothetical protein FACS1894139_12620 [Planctomycetales bacterium]